MWLADASDGVVRLTGADEKGGLVRIPVVGAAASAADEALTAVNPAGGGVAAWAALDPQGAPAVAVQQDFPSGFTQTALLSGRQGGPVAQLSLAHADSGEALLAFLQGAAGDAEVVADRVTVVPTSFAVELPSHWVRPAAARISWEAPASAPGGLTYAVVLDGQVVARGLTATSLRPNPRLLGDGVLDVQVLATDALGQEVLSPASELMVDARPPTVSVGAARAARRRSRGGRRSRARSGHASAHRPARRRGRSRPRVLPLGVLVRVRDRESGVLAAATTCSFGDGTPTVRGRAVCAHAYRRPGRYTIVVHARDRVGNASTSRLAVQVR
jgi:hypothetical protein